VAALGINRPRNPYSSCRVGHCRSIHARGATSTHRPKTRQCRAYAITVSPSAGQGGGGLPPTGDSHQRRQRLLSRHAYNVCD
jgi:hypothetical protein